MAGVKIMVTIDTVEAHDDISKLWDKAAEGPVTVQKAGSPIAVVLSPKAYQRLASARPPRQFGCGRHLLSGAGVAVNDLLAVPIDDAFSVYMTPSQPPSAETTS